MGWTPCVWLSVATKEKGVWVRSVKREGVSKADVIIEELGILATVSIVYITKSCYNSIIIYEMIYVYCIYHT